MEHFIVVDHMGRNLEAASVSLDECRKAVQDYRSACYYYAPSGFLALHGSDYAKAYSWCQDSEAEFRLTCVRGTAAQAMKDNVAKPSAVSSLCRSFDKADRPACISGAISIYINIQNSSEVAKSLCTTTFKDYEQVCLQTVEQRRQRFDI